MSQKTKKYWVKYIPFLIIPLLVISWGISKYKSPNEIPVIHLQIKTNLSPMGQEVLPEQRRTYALKLQKNENPDYKGAVFTTTGDFHTTLSIESNRINSKMATSMSSTGEPFSDVRKMGFKHLKMSNGKEAWDIDLSN
ncbi:MAG: hypothetical protein P4L44_16850 [Oryzomonas sp.]|uniref:hypothetical protein n=1 Tax=Oryzomonas sp. TaxID=2855186 RepID=UPI00283E044D|nr:hypothetical protein [Oryzomonas sp.]MDR3581631.1 hypothetical protein [Oryzomonas sp.]